MRIPSGTVDQYIYFVGVDATDFATRETGLSTFTVYRSRNGGAAAAMTTPTINETDGTNMPGVYELLLDEDMTIDAGDDSQEMVFHITHAGMAPVTRTIELYRPKITAGYTLGVAADGDLLEVNTLTGHTVQTGDSYALIGSAGAGLTAVPWNASWDAEVESEVTDALNSYDPPTKAELDSAVAPLATSSALSTVAGYLDTEIAAILADTNELQGDWADGGRLDLILDARASQTSVDTVDGIVDAILIDTAEIGAAGAGLTALASAANLAIVDTVVDAILVDTAEIGAAGAGLTALATAAALATVDTEVGNLQTDVTAILADTADMQPKIGTPAGVSVSADIAAIKVDTAATLVDTNELQTDWTNGGRLDLLIDAIKVVTDALPNGGALTSLATAAALATVDTVVDAILVDTDTTIPALIAALNDLAASDILTTQLVESYPTDGTAPTLSQAIFLIQQFLYERSTSGTTVTVKKLDGSTTAATLTLDDGTTPTSITRAS